MVRLATAANESIEVFGAPLDVQLSERTVLQPDLLVMRAADVDDDGTSTTPLLAVEVLSPSTRRRDLMTKLDILQRAGCPHYRVIDPEDVSVRIWDLVDGAYVLTTHALGDREVRVTEPVELAFTVSELMPPKT